MLLSLLTGLVSHTAKTHKEIKHLPSKLAKVMAAYQPADKGSPDKVGHVQMFEVVGPHVCRK